MKRIALLILAILTLGSCFSKKETSSQKEEIMVIEQSESQPVEKVFIVVEEMPEFPGGMDAMLQYLSENLNYPEEARKKKIEGKVYTQFIINEDGTVSDVKVARGLGHGCDKESIRVVKSMPKWTPGKQRGKPVKVRMILPIMFKLKSKEKN